MKQEDFKEKSFWFTTKEYSPSNPLQGEIEDAIQEVFLECFKQGGVLGKADPNRPGGFRNFFSGVLRNIALKYERKHARKPHVSSPSVMERENAAAPKESPSEIFDRAWARSIMKEARAHHASLAREKGEKAVRRAELLRLRFQERMPIREIAGLWKVDRAYLHHEYAQAREEFEKALREVIAGDHPGNPGEVDRVLANLLSILS